MSVFDQLLNSGRPWAVQRAQSALQIQQAIQSGSVSKSEGIELLQDLIATDTLDKEANDFTTRTILINVITDLINAITSVK